MIVFVHVLYHRHTATYGDTLPVQDNNNGIIFVLRLRSEGHV